MKLSIAIQMDPIASIDIQRDSSFALGLEAQKRGHKIWCYTPSSLSLSEGEIWANGNRLTLREEIGNHYDMGPMEKCQLKIFDVILMRQDPPFDMSYITATHILEMLPASTMVINNPAEVRNAPEKLLAMLYPELMPATLISRDFTDISEFRALHKDIIIKPLYGNGGAGVFRLMPNDQNLNSLLEMFFTQSREPVIVQTYVPEVRDGDKRVILVNGMAVGAVNRIPKEGEARSNFHAGGSAKGTTLTSRDKEICESLGPMLRQRSLLFVGIDIIGNYLTEINVTSPTGIREIKALSNVDVASLTWDTIEKERLNYAGNSIHR